MYGNTAHEEGFGGGGGGSVRAPTACSSLFICSANVAAASQWSLRPADDRLPEATGARRSNDDLSARNVLQLHPISLAPPTFLYFPGLLALLGQQAKLIKIMNVIKQGRSAIFAGFHGGGSR